MNQKERNYIFAPTACNESSRDILSINGFSLEALSGNLMQKIVY
jgi:hypothetical protein